MGTFALLGAGAANLMGLGEVVKVRTGGMVSLSPAGSTLSAPVLPTQGLRGFRHGCQGGWMWAPKGGLGGLCRGTSYRVMTLVPFGRDGYFGDLAGNRAGR